MTSESFDLDAIRERLSKATPGPWEWMTDEGAPFYIQLYATQESPADKYGANILSGEDWATVLTSQEDADFISHAPTDIATLLEALERAERVLKVLLKNAEIVDPDGQAEEYFCWDILPEFGDFLPDDWTFLKGLL